MQSRDIVMLAGCVGLKGGERIHQLDRLPEESAGNGKK
jgi:hypothetical protein